MPKQVFEKTTTVGDKVYFAGEAELSEKEVTALEAAKEAEDSESQESEEAEPKRGRKKQ